MSNTRTSNKQILEAIERLTGAVEKLVINQTPNIPTLNPDSEGTGANVQPTNPQRGADIRIDPKYLEHMQHKAQDHATLKKEDVVLYSRRNKTGEIKLAYALASRFPTIKDRGMIGTLGTFAPSN